MSYQYYTIEPLYQAEQPSNIITSSGITSNWKYRQYMQKNANDIMRCNVSDYMLASGNDPFTLINTSPVNDTPILFNSIHDNKKTPCGYPQSDLKSNYITKERMKSRMVAPTITTNF